MSDLSTIDPAILELVGPGRAEIRPLSVPERFANESPVSALFGVADARPPIAFTRGRYSVTMKGNDGMSIVVRLERRWGARPTQLVTDILFLRTPTGATMQTRTATGWTSCSVDASVVFRRWAFMLGAQYSERERDETAIERAPLPVAVTLDRAAANGIDVRAMSIVRQGPRTPVSGGEFLIVRCCPAPPWVFDQIRPAAAIVDDTDPDGLVAEIRVA